MVLYVSTFPDILDILLYKEEVRLTPVKLNELKSSWHIPTMMDFRNTIGLGFFMCGLCRDPSS